MRTAILIDGAYFIRRFRSIEPHNRVNATRAADLAWRWAVSHLSDAKKKNNNGTPMLERRSDLYRIFFYDCPPLTKKLHNPISAKSCDFSKTDEACFRLELHEALRKRGSIEGLCERLTLA